MKTIIKCLVWSAMLLAIALAMVYGFWLILIFMLFDEKLYMALTIAGEFLIFCAYFWMIRAAE